MILVNIVVVRDIIVDNIDNYNNIYLYTKRIRSV